MVKNTAKKKTAKKKKETESDESLWRAVAEGVTPLDPAAKNVARDVIGARGTEEKATPVPKMPARQKRNPAVAPAARARAAPPPPDLGHGTVAGLDKRTAERMKRGQLKSEGRLDLHGLTQDEAQRALRAFVAAAHGAGKRQILVITGKGEGGTGVLKAAVPRWLNGADLRDKIVAFDYAQPKDGGEGALYVRLRKPKPASAISGGRGKP